MNINIQPGPFPIYYQLTDIFSLFLLTFLPILFVIFITSIIILKLFKKPRSMKKIILFGLLISFILAGLLVFQHFSACYCSVEIGKYKLREQPSVYLRSNYEQDRSLLNRFWHNLFPSQQNSGVLL